MNIRKIISKEMILESRLDDAKALLIQDFKDELIPLSYREGRRMPEWFEDLVGIDPSGNQKYLMWALKHIRGNGKFHPYSVNHFILNAVRDGIEMFHELQNKLTPENIQKVTSWKMGDKDFDVLGSTRSSYGRSKYPIKMLEKIMKSPKDINSYDDPFLFFDLMESIGKIPSKSDIKKEGIKLLNNEYWSVIVPLTYRASCSYGAGTRWCTTAKEGPVQFNRYQTRVSSLFYFIPNSEPIGDDGHFTKWYGDEYDLSKIALHINMESEFTFYDAADDEIDSDIIEELVINVYGLDSWLVFQSGINRCKDYHSEKLDKNGVN